MNEINDVYLAKIQGLSHEEATKISKIVELIYFVEQDRKSERKFFIPLSHFPKEISKFEIITLLTRLGEDFHVIVFCGLINGETEEYADIYYPKDSLLFDFRNLMQEKTKEIKPVALDLKSAKIIFNDASATLEANDVKCQMPPNKNEHQFVRAMYGRGLGNAVEWDLLYEEILGSVPTDKEKNMRTVQDTMYSINNRIMEDFATEEKFFSWKNKSVIRNF